MRRAALLRAMSKREPAANASSSGVAPRRSSTGSRGADRTATEETNRRGRVGSRGAGGGWREPAGAAEATAAGRREPPLCFGVKNDVVGAVIGERGRRPGSLRDGAAASGLQQRGAAVLWKARVASAVKVFPVFPAEGQQLSAEVRPSPSGSFSHLVCFSVKSEPQLCRCWKV